MPRPDQDELITMLVNEIVILHGRMLAEGDALAAPAGLTAARWLVLGGLADGPSTAAALARRRGLRRQSVQETVDRLCRAGLVAKTPNPADRRAPLLRVTETGHDALEAIEAGRHAWATRLGGEVPADDLDVTLRTLRAVRAAIEEPHAPRAASAATISAPLSTAGSDRRSTRPSAAARRSR